MREKRWSVTFRTSDGWLTDRIFKTEEEAKAFMDDKDQVEDWLINSISVGRKFKSGRVKFEDVECKLDETYVIKIC